jgi:Na+-transporting NADH:ubiquinone oxidoreductase subunit NqrA
MKQNLFDVAAKNEIIKRSLKLTANSQPAWGSMTPVEMLRHCSEAIQATLKPRPFDTPPTLRQKVAKFIMINFVPRLPKGAKAPKHINMQLQPFTLETFESEIENFAKAVEVFSTHKEPILNKHPYFGTMTNKQWGITSWMHMDHHLRQFSL